MKPKQSVSDGVREVLTGDLVHLPRVRFAFWVVVVSMLVPLGELIYREGTTTVPSIVQTLVVVIVLLRISRSSSQTTSTTLFVLALLCASSAIVSILNGDSITAMLLLVLITMVSATLVPWGLMPQLATVGLSITALLVTVIAVEDGFAHFGWGMLSSVTFAFVVSLYVAHEVERTRIRAATDERERDRAAQALRLVESAIEQANDAVVVMSAERGLVGPRIVFVNPAFSRLSGFSEDDAAGRSLRAIFSPADESGAIERLYDAMREARPAIGEGTFRRRDGTVYMVEWHIAPVRSTIGEITNWVAIVRDTTQRTRAEQVRSALLDVARSTSGELDLEQLLQSVQHQIGELLPCDRVATFLWDEPTQTLALASSHGFPETGTAESALATRYQPGPELRQQWLSGKTISVDPPKGQSWIPRDVLEGLGVTAALGTPLQARGHLIGALLAANAKGSPRFDGSQIQLLEGIARQVALAIDAAGLFQAQREDAEVSSALARVGSEMISSLSTPVLLGRLCQLTTEILHCDSSHTFLWHPEESVYLPVSRHGDTDDEWERVRQRAMTTNEFQGLLARLRRDDSVQLVTRPDTPADPGTAFFAEAGFGSSICVALRRGKELIGFQLAHYRAQAHPFSHRQERIVRGVGYLASMGLENARLVEELERANRVKSDFVATMSHELRTPLNVILGYNELLLSGSFGDLTGEQEQPLQRADRNAKELLELIDATLDLSRLEQQSLPLNISGVEVAPLVEEVARETASFAEKPAVELHCDLPADLPLLDTDSVKLRMVLKNLITNAFKFTPAGTVTVSARSLDDGIEFAVADTGIGMAAESQSVIFEPFRQIDSSDTRRYRGAGLGLHIVDRLLKALGGTITVSSELGRGSTFRVWLPTRFEESERGVKVELLAVEKRAPSET